MSRAGVPMLEDGDEDIPWPSREQIDAILRFTSRLDDPKAQHSAWHTEPDVMPWCELSKDAGAFLQALYDNAFVVGFDWPAWHEEARKYFDSPIELATADLLTIRRLLTLHVRKDRFCEGHFAAMLKNGHMHAVLRRLAAIRLEMDSGFLLDDSSLDDAMIQLRRDAERYP